MTCRARLQRVRDVTSKNFGLLIAYILPGFTVLWGLSQFSPTLREWISGSVSAGPTVGGFLYVTLASVMSGLSVSTVRWLLIDSVHHATGLPRPAWDYSKLQAKIAGFDALVESHYRYYQWYSNMVIALVAYAICRHIAMARILPDGPDAAALLLASLFAVASRETLSNYYRRVAQLLGTEVSETAAAE